MPKTFAFMPDGSTIIVRKEYDPRDYTVPQTELERLTHIRSNYGSLDVLEEHDGELSGYHRIRDLERDGKQWTLLQDSREFAIEVELTRNRMGEIRPLAPLEAWDLAIELDRQEVRHPIAVEASHELYRAGRQPLPG